MRNLEREVGYRVRDMPTEEKLGLESLLRIGGSATSDLACF
jgi:hypothetical protein